ncbi:MAG: HAD-IIIC family phosphatase [Rhizobacter sp.]
MGFDRELSRALHAHRRELAAAFAAALEPTPKWQPIMAARRAEWDAFLQSEFFAFVDYLAEYFARGDRTFRQLFIGEKIKSLYDPTLDDAARREQVQAVAAAERRGLAEVLQRRVPPEAWQRLAGLLGEVTEILLPKNVRTQRVLLIGDCLFLDILPFVVGDLLEAGIELVPDFATSKNPVELRDHLRRLAAKKFDLVFYSPFSYEFSAEYVRLLHWRQAGLGAAQVDAAVDALWGDTRATLDLAADLFDCPIHVHNAGAVVREEAALKRFLKLKATARVRALARERIGSMLEAHVATKNAAGFRHLFIVDESALVRASGEMRAGAYLYRTALQHPAMLGRLLAPLYADAVYVNAHLASRKLVVCDLDNTLWDGVIGEGAVTHHHERQQLLKALKGKGVVLAINSKNDPANVHWRGGTLTADDFVCAAISWEPKVNGMKRIQHELNLKPKDYVFIDDRPDELALMRMAYPQVLCLDATDPCTWRRFGLWSHVLEEAADMDRTLMYQQREQRKAFVVEDTSTPEEKAALLKALQLRLAITRAGPADLKRVTTLVNRTNQFNLRGSRTTLKEVTEWHRSPLHWIVTGQTADRFGDMGTTCVAVAHVDGDELEVLVFVLSCRVFGYGVEDGVMNHLKAEAARLGLRRIVGRHVATPENAPCRTFLADNGFEPQADGRWTFQVGTSAPANAEWLDVVVAGALA